MTDTMDFSTTGLYTDYNFPINNLCKHEYIPELVEELEELYSSLSIDHDVAHFNLYPTEIEIQAINSLQIDRINEDEYYSEGHQATINKYEFIQYDLENFHSNVKSYFDSLSTSNKEISDIVVNFISKTASSIMSIKNSESVVCIFRSYTPNNQPYMPRWHTDQCLSAESFPTIISLKGPSTLFYNASIEEREVFSSINNKTMDADDIDTQINLYNHLELSIHHSAPKIGYGSMFLCGNESYGAIHTHPAVQEDRIFLAIIAGSKSEITVFKDMAEEDTSS